MKKLLLLLAGTISIVGANAQYAKNNSLLFNGNSRKAAVAEPFKAEAAPHHAVAKTTLAGIATETFGTGTPTTLPTGWSAGVIGGAVGKWHWTNTAATSTYSGFMGTMHSTTASNGWMIYDSDSIGTACSCTPAGWLQSPAYNCTGHTTVRLNFENYFDSFNDSCVVWVSTSPTFATYTRFPVLLNNGLGPNVSTPNDTKVHINITSAAAGMAAVYIRFVYYSNATGGGYAWMIDDMSLTELYAHDVSIEKGFMYEGEPTGTCYSGSIFNTPLVYVDSVSPVTLLSDLGSSAEASVTATAKIYQGTTSVYTQTSTYTSLPANAYDSVVQFPSYKPTATGSYICAMSAALSNDSDLTNNVDTATFAVTDTTWMEAQGNISGGYYVHRATGGSPISYMQGARFDVPPTSVGDTVSGFGVAFSSSSVATGTGKVSVQLYSVKDGVTSGWTYVATSVARSLTAADISSSSSIVWADFRIDQAASGGITPFILQPGTSYAAMIQINGVSTNLVVYSVAAPHATGFSGYFGQSDTSQNDGSTSFGAHSIATGSTAEVPLVRMYNGPIPPNKTAVNNVSLVNTVGAAYPNPANTMINIPFSVAQDGSVKVTLTNMVGQVVRTQVADATAGQPMNTRFNTSDLTNGVYIYSVDANGQHNTGRIVIAH